MMVLKKGMIAAASMIVVLVATAMPAFSAMNAKQYWEKGDQYADNKLYIDAVENFSQAIRLNKGEIGIEDVARIFHSRGLAYLGLHDDDKALDDFGNAIRLDEKNPEFYISRGRYFLEHRKFDMAQDDLDRALKLDRKNVTAYLLRGRSSLEEGEYDRAIADFGEVLSLEPQNTAVLFPLGMAYKGSGKMDRALEAFNKLLEQDPKNAEAPYQEAAIFSRSGKIDSACVWLESAAESGFSDWQVLKQDRDFDNLRKVDCYRRLLQGK
jgi:tetratricopeptide (TPR) repeat protein